MLLWAEQCTRFGSQLLPKKVDQIRLPDAEALTEGDLEIRRMKLGALGGLHQSIIEFHGTIDRHPWHGIEAVEVNLFDQEDILASASQMALALEAFHASAQEVNEQLGTEIVNSIATAEQIRLGVSRLPLHFAEMGKTPLNSLSNPKAREALKRFLMDLERGSAAISKLSKFGNAEKIRANTEGPGR
jgi:hypothetical protein